MRRVLPNRRDRADRSVIPLGVEITGVGGQGVARTADLLASAALNRDLHATVLESRGLAVRGGAVSVQVRMAAQPGHPPRCSPEAIHVILALEPLEGARVAMRRSPGALLLVNASPILPEGVFHDAYPQLETLERELKRRHDHVVFVRGPDSLPQANIFCLGALASIGGSGVETDVLLQEVSGSFGREGARSFEAGRAHIEQRGLAAAWRTLLPR